MEIGVEISKKIRSAIKAKLVELGAYVDDELPDYIMVMVANKKRREHMVTDLGLFLGNNAEKFANWLHELLNKLQAISSEKEEKKKPCESKKGLPQSSAEPSSKPVEHHKRHSSSGQGDAVLVKSRKTESAGPVGSTPHSSAPGEKSKTVGSAGPASAAMVKPLPAFSHATTPAGRVPDTDEEPLLQVQADTDEFSEELLLLEDEEEAGRKFVSAKSVPAKAVPVQAVRSTSREEAPTRPAPTSKTSETAKPNVATKAWSEVQPIPKPASSLPQAPCLSSQSSAVPPEPSLVPPQERSASASASRKRRAPTSVVGSVKKTAAEEEEEEYDPYNPAVGSVASVVKVTARKSSVPTAMQANKSLLLKAVSDAEKSILSKRSSGMPSQAMIRPIPRDGGDLRDRLSAAAIADVRSRLSAVAAASDARTRFSGATSSAGEGISARPTLAVRASPDGRQRIVAARRLGESNARARLSAAASHDVRVGVKRSTMVDARTRLPPSTTADKESRLQGRGTGVIPTSRPTAASRLSQLQTVTRTIDVPEYIPTRKAIIVVRREEEEKAADAPDSRVVEMEEQQSLPSSRGSSQDWERREESMQEVEEYQPEEVPVPPIPEILTDNDLEDYSFIEDEPGEQVSPAVIQPHPQEPQWEPPAPKRLVQEKAKSKSADTKFIVTLDGVDLDAYEGKTMELEDEDAANANGDSMKEESSLAKKAPPKIKPFSISLKDSDDELEQECPRQAARSTERCRYWPACMNGNTCEYHHPTQPCKTFPKCKFGDKCLFIHPNCKFDSRCTRPDCPFTHASRRQPVSFQAPQVIAIPHHGIPMIVTSTPQRQVPCRFFPNCTNLKCSFYHPKSCRYGPSCLNKSCSFYHPAVPSKDKLKWTASSAMLGKTV